ncbi:MAG: GHMP kinase [Acidobacteriota bacterium]|nr:GHMP kinase [Acidobacteriota bacterium]
MTEGIAYARAGLLGNPSDGYFGKIIAVSVRNFRARVMLEESAELVIVPAAEDEERYAGLDEFARGTYLYGYYGGVRLVKAAVKKFHDYIRSSGLALPPRCFTLRYESDIPRQIGLAGSSAIITATLRALMAFYGAVIPKEVQPSLVLSAERDELDINAGFMDRVIQVYEGCVFMDLDERLLRAEGHGRYEPLDPGLLPPLYLAYKPALGKVSGRVLNEIRVKYDRGDAFTIEALRRLGELAERGKRALLQGDRETFVRMMDENFELRRSIQEISPANQEMIAAARACGASAKYAGSGGSIIGAYRDEAMWADVRRALEAVGAVVLRPVI